MQLQAVVDHRAVTHLDGPGVITSKPIQGGVITARLRAWA